ncbi:MAG: response regulator [Eubacteriales bacterium]|nr:response regulator [Eubacteriales bacterium]
MYKLLVADDETIERIVVCKTLEQNFGEECVVFQAKNGREALEIYEKEKCQIAILDIEMPGITGLEAARRIRSQDEDCVIIFLTAYDEFSYAKQAISIRVLDYLLKPCSGKELLFTVEAAMQQVQGKARLVQSAAGEEDSEEEPDNEKLAMVKKAAEEYIRKNYGKDISMQSLAARMNYSEAYFCKLFKQCFHMNFMAYLVDYRMAAAREMLENTAKTIKEIGREVGYQDPNYFTKVFKRTVGMKPSEYRLKAVQKNS